MEPTPSPSAIPTPVPPLDAWLGSLAAVVAVVTIVVVIAGLVFAWNYHKRVLSVIQRSLQSGYSIQAQDTGAIERAKMLAPIIQEDDDKTPSLAMAGPTTLITGQIGRYSVINALEGETFEWHINGDENTLTTTAAGVTFGCIFQKPGLYVITVTSDKPNRVADALIQVAEPVSSKSISLPFAVGNWGGFVITAFGVGAITMLMLTQVLESGAGIGVLGTLLGVGTAGIVNSQRDPDGKAKPDAPADNPNPAPNLSPPPAGFEPIPSPQKATPKRTFLDLFGRIGK